MKKDLTDKEKIVVWSIAAWFQVKPLVTGSLMEKLYPNLDDKQYKYDRLIEDRIISVGKWLEKKRLEEQAEPQAEEQG